MSTRDFMTSPHDSLRAPREASPAFRIASHYHANHDRWVGYGLAFVYGSLCTLSALGLLTGPY